jgi:hypothetical protein
LQFGVQASPCPRGVRFPKTHGDQGVQRTRTVHTRKPWRVCVFGKMPTETNTVSDPPGHHDPHRKSHKPPKPTGTAALRKSRFLVDVSRVLTASFFSLTTSHLALSDDSSGGNSDIFLDRIIVTATRTPEDESQIGSSFSQLTGEELQTEQIDDLKTALIRRQEYLP